MNAAIATTTAINQGLALGRHGPPAEDVDVPVPPEISGGEFMVQEFPWTDAREIRRRPTTWLMATVPGELSRAQPGGKGKGHPCGGCSAPPSCAMRRSGHGQVMPSLLPTTTQSLVQLDQGRKLVATRLRQLQFGREVVGVVGEDLNVVRGSGFEAHF